MAAATEVVALDRDALLLLLLLLLVIGTETQVRILVAAFFEVFLFGKRFLRDH